MFERYIFGPEICHLLFKCFFLEDFVLCNVYLHDLMKDIYTRSQLEALAANKEGFFARKMAENKSRPEGLPPSQGGKYVGFGSSLTSSPQRRNDAQNDYFSSVSQVFFLIFFL